MLEAAGRRPELDAIRLVVVLGLVFFHSALVFDERDDFYVKNAQTTEAVTWVAGLGVVWAMPAGAAGRTCCSSSTASCWRPTTGSGRRCAATPSRPRSSVSCCSARPDVAIVAISFAVMVTVYDLLVRRTAATRFLFGLR